MTSASPIGSTTSNFTVSTASSFATISVSDSDDRDSSNSVAIGVLQHYCYYHYSTLLTVKRIPATILVGTLNFAIGMASALDIDILVNQVLVFVKYFIPNKVMLGFCLGICPLAQWIISCVHDLPVWWREAAKRGSQ